MKINIVLCRKNMFLILSYPVIHYVTPSDLSHHTFGGLEPQVGEHCFSVNADALPS